LRSRKGVSDPVFLYYLSISDIVKIPAERSMSGATGRQRAEHKVVQNIELKVPKLQTQQKIASVLSAYDDLIENNNRRIKILEEMAQVIYNEWFVKFRFPGSPYAKATEDKYEKVKIKNGIPEELEEKEILDIEYFNFCRSKVSKYEGKREYFATANIDGINVIKEGELVLFKEKPSRAQIQPKINSVWFARMKDSYKVLAYREINKDLADKHILSSGMIGFEAKEDYFGFLYFTINSEWFHNLKDQYATGATQVSLTNEGLAKMKILAPNKEIVKEYSKGVNIFIDEILNLQRVNNNLRKTRDLLLPKLMSGGIEI
jgi:type I restriction enzyme S subunit